MLPRLALLVVVAGLTLVASVAFSRLSGRSAVHAMGLAMLAVAGLAALVFLLFTWLTRQFV